MATTTIPSACYMPELAEECPSLRGRVLLQDAFVGNPSLTEKAVTLRKHFIRLLDQSIREYTSARDLILAQIEEMARPPMELMRESGPRIFLFSFVEHLENCLTTCRRALHVLDGLKKEVTVDRDTRCLIEAHGGSITNIRDCIEHMGERIASGAIQSGDLLVPYLSEDTKSVELAGYSIRLDDLAGTLKALHSVAASLLPRAC